MTLAVVFGGGGVRGAFQAGVWQQLAKAGVHPDFAIGSSIGAINALAITRLSGNQLVHWWRWEVPDSLVHLPDRKPLYGPQVKRLASLPQRSAFPAYAVATNTQTKKAEVHRLTGSTEQLTAWLMASSAFPIVFQPVVIASTRYVDGGLVNDLPVDLARKLGADTVIAVSAAGLGPTPEDQGDFFLPIPRPHPKIMDFSRATRWHLITLGQQAGAQLAASDRFQRRVL